MGGHGGLNILPQKRWNVYNFDNREKVKRDEEAAAKDEQLKQEQIRRRDSELRLIQLRQARGLNSSSSEPKSEKFEPKSVKSEKFDSKSVKSELKLEKSEKFESTSEKFEAKLEKKESKHIDLFEGIRIFDPVIVEESVREDRDKKRMKKEKEPRVILPEDEKYRLGYGIVGKGAKLPWYMMKPSDKKGDESENDDDDDSKRCVKKSNGKKTVEELRKERLEREKKEKGRERALLMEKSRRDGGFSRHR